MVFLLSVYQSHFVAKMSLLCSHCQEKFRSRHVRVITVRHYFASVNQALIITLLIFFFLIIFPSILRMIIIMLFEMIDFFFTIFSFY